VNDEQNILNIENIYVGLECENLLESLSLECRQIKLWLVNKVWLDFKTTVQEMLKHLSHKNPLFKHLIFLEPKTALYDESRIKIKDLTHIAIIVKNINITYIYYKVLNGKYYHFW